MFPFHRHVEPLEVGEIGGVGGAFHHAEEVEFAANDVDFVNAGGRMVFDFVNLRPEVFEVSAADVGLGAYSQTGDFLTGTAFLQAGLVGVDGEMAFRDDALQFLPELAIGLIHIVVAAEGDVVSIARVGEVEPSGKACQTAVERHGADVGDDGRGRGALRHNVLNTVIHDGREGADGGDFFGHQWRDSNPNQIVFHHASGDAGEKVREVEVEHIVATDVPIGVVDNRSSSDECHRFL